MSGPPKVCRRGGLWRPLQGINPTQKLLKKIFRPHKMSIFSSLLKFIFLLLKQNFFGGEIGHSSLLALFSEPRLDSAQTRRRIKTCPNAISWTQFGLARPVLCRINGECIHRRIREWDLFLFQTAALLSIKGSLLRTGDLIESTEIAGRGTMPGKVSRRIEDIFWMIELASCADEQVWAEDFLSQHRVSKNKARLWRG